jgi:hypothetical protein
LQKVVNVLNLPTTHSVEILVAAFGLIGPLVEAPAAPGVAIQGVIDAIKTGDAASVLSSVVEAPAVIASGVLNGRIGPNIGDLVAPALGLPPGVLTAVFGGLLSPVLSVAPSGAIEISGTLAGLQTLQGLIADALNPVAKAKTATLASDIVDAPSASPILSSTLGGVKATQALTVKPTTTPATQAASTATATATTATPAPKAPKRRRVAGTARRRPAARAAQGVVATAPRNP